MAALDYIFRLPPRPMSVTDRGAGLPQLDEIVCAEADGRPVSAELIYLDVEHLDSPGTPALLGVLTTRDDTSARFRIYLLNPRLARAATAHRGCRVADLVGALTEILADDGAIVTWGAHGRRIVRRPGVPAHLRERFEARWVNALTDVRRWKRRLYGDWNLPTLDGTGHALAMYMTAVGYDVPASRAPGTTAIRVRHALEQLERASGDNRNPPGAAKRHWHALLEYKSHDCLGMHAVHGRATRELALEAAYRQTTYRVALDDGGARIRIGRRHRTSTRSCVPRARRGGRALPRSIRSRRRYRGTRITAVIWR
jgi:hypothetical protein